MYTLPRCTKQQPISLRIECSFKPVLGYNQYKKLKLESKLKITQLQYLRGHVIRSKLWCNKISTINLGKTKISKLDNHILFVRQ